MTSRLLRAALALALVVAAATGHAQDFTDDRAFPDGARGQRVRQLLDAIDSRQLDRVDALVRDAFGGSLRALPIADHREVLGALQDEGLDFHSVRRYAAGSGPQADLVVIARSRLTEAFRALVLRFDAEARITSLEVAPARSPKDLPVAGPLDRAQAVALLDAFVDKLTKAEVFSGTALLAKDGQIVWETARGLAERNHGVPMRIDSKLNLGSMNKMFTAVVIGQLVDEGRLRFDDPVSKYLQGWTKADLSKVRIEHLLSHTSGLGSYFNRTWARTARQTLRRVGDYQPLVAEETLAFEPGTRWQYSNTGFLLAGAVIEAVTGRDYFDVVRERVYARAGMRDSDCYDIDLAVPHLATGYSRERTLGPGGAPGRWRANSFEHVIRGGPAGGGYSTAHDLLAFAEALRAGKLVSTATRERLWSARPEFASPSYGFGFGVSQGPLGRVVGHTGGFPGISSSLAIADGWTLVVLTNTDDGMAPVDQKLREVAARLH
ncbi:MAG: beta-lactamase family protein [Vicinamibacteria bacterium]|nr:beta-lactamase family protein [Vicinamibacteria bacterium]